MEGQPNKISSPKPSGFGANDFSQADSAAEIRQQRSGPRARPRLANTLRVVNDMMDAGVIGRYAIGGAVGATFYLEPVTTMDVDIFVAIHADPGQLIIKPTAIYDYLLGRGYKSVGDAIQVEDWLVQFLPPASPLVEEAIARAREVRIADDVATFVLTAEHLIAIALQIGRPKDNARILQFIDAKKHEPDALRDILERHNLDGRWLEFQRRFFQQD